MMSSRTKLSEMRTKDGDYNESSTFTALRSALGNSCRPAHYLAIPPSLFATVIAGLGASGLNQQARVIVEKHRSWGPKEADALIAADGGWYNPRFADGPAD